MPSYKLPLQQQQKQQVMIPVKLFPIPIAKGNRSLSIHSVKTRWENLFLGKYFNPENLMKRLPKKRFFPIPSGENVLPAASDSGQLPGLQLHQMLQLSTTSLSLLS